MPPVSEIRESMFDTLAFAGRYGHQDVRGLMDMPAAFVSGFNRAVGRLLKQENGKGSGSSPFDPSE